ncbi:MAG TPA: hypothetical protein VN238_11365 [Solirubrobacteraceae bacterium]|nr:hypothetical protein [Solirubrobacteraceae bacterium]
MPGPPAADAGEYPFGRAAGSFFLAGGEALLHEPPSRPPLLAYGANASPERLAAKLPGVPVAALAAQLRGWSVVHSAHVSPYGAVPATLLEAPGERAAVHVLVVDPVGFEPLDATEPNYVRRRLEGVDLDADRLGRIPVAEAYISRWGPLIVNGGPVPLGALSQAALVAHVRDGV